MERERLRMAEQGGQVSVFDWNLKTGEIFSTGELEKLFGLASGERVDCYANWAGLVHPEDLARLEADWAAWPQSGRREHRWTYRLVRPDGQVRWLEARAEVLRDAAGEPWRLVGTQADITERRQRAESPQQTEEGFRALLELAPDAMLVHQEGRLVFVNAAAVRFFGARGPEELLGRSALELVHPQERASVQVRARRVLVRGGT
ncbi:MAG TPA: PAS domain-containing protein, partial [Candidatus Sulfotelmatobacter sp.]|nr:PAS domain-containing protein [Candidatus Sulfotelmatobacter sp.]